MVAMFRVSGCPYKQISVFILHLRSINARRLFQAGIPGRGIANLLPSRADRNKSANSGGEPSRV